MSLRKSLRSSSSFISPENVARYFCQKKIDPDFLVKKFINSAIGFGVFVTKDVLPGEFLCEYDGVLLEKEPNNSESNNYLFSNIIHCGKKFYLDGSNSKQMGAFINDTSVQYQNCKMKKVILDNKPCLCLFSVSEIKSGTELRYNYGDNVENLWWRTNKILLQPYNLSDIDLKKDYSQIPVNTTSSLVEALPSPVSVSSLLGSNSFIDTVGVLSKTCAVSIPVNTTSYLDEILPSPASVNSLLGSNSFIKHDTVGALSKTCAISIPVVTSSLFDEILSSPLSVDSYLRSNLNVEPRREEILSKSCVTPIPVNTTSYLDEILPSPASVNSLLGSNSFIKHDTVGALSKTCAISIPVVTSSLFDEILSSPLSVDSYLRSNLNVEPRREEILSKSCVTPLGSNSFIKHDTVGALSKTCAISIPVVTSSLFDEILSSPLSVDSYLRSNLNVETRREEILSKSCVTPIPVNTTSSLAEVLPSPVSVSSLVPLNKTPMVIDDFFSSLVTIDCNNLDQQKCNIVSDHLESIDFVDFTRLDDPNKCFKRF
ncbi:uncharacterized protein LOC105845542 isoform X3 [Hydra vulgaris]|uniref:uncharacterized protein LOC105845542 isoform X3 n=1 Tax=Hydra vulgaris TaxID=6087 RepID=UPI0032EA37FC